MKLAIAIALALLTAPAAARAQSPITVTEADLANIPTGYPGGPGQPEIKLTLEQRMEMARRQKAQNSMRLSPPTLEVEARVLDALPEEPLRAISSALDPAGGATAALPTGQTRDRWELAWYSGRLARDGAYLQESRIPEGKAVDTYLLYEPASGGGESWPPRFLPGFSPTIEHGDMRRALTPMLFEMRVDAQADGAMVFALLASMGGQKVLVPGIKVQAEGFAKVAVPGGHTIAVYATLRDQTAQEREHLKRMLASRAQGQQALDDERIAINTTLPPGIDPSLAVPPNVVDRMRTTVRNESVIRALGASP